MSFNNNIASSSSATPLDYYLNSCRTHNCRAHTDVVRMLHDAKSYSDITEMDFSRTIVGHTNFDPLLDILKKCSALRVLLFPSNSIDNDRAIKLCDALEENTQLVRLVLSGNPISDSGGKRIAKLVTSQNYCLAAAQKKERHSQQCESDSTAPSRNVVASSILLQNHLEHSRTASSSSANDRRALKAKNSSVEGETAITKQQQQERENYLFVDVSSTHMNYGLMRRISSSVPSSSSCSPLFVVVEGQQQQQQSTHQNIYDQNNTTSSENGRNMKIMNDPRHEESLLELHQQQQQQFYALEVLWSVAAKELIVAGGETKNIDNNNKQKDSASAHTNYSRFSADHDHGGGRNINNNIPNRPSNSSSSSTSSPKVSKLSIPVVAISAQNTDEAETTARNINNANLVDAASELAFNDEIHRRQTATTPKRTTTPNGSADHLHLHHPDSENNNNMNVSPFQNLQQLDREEREKYLGSGLPCLVQCIRTSPSSQQKIE